jgi:hypothetical protein
LEKLGFGACREHITPDTRKTIGEIGFSIKFKVLVPPLLPDSL